jgi:hypothetical protein
VSVLQIALSNKDQAPGNVVYPGYAQPVYGPGCYWTSQPVYDGASWSIYGATRDYTRSGELNITEADSHVDQLDAAQIWRNIWEWLKR